jgi:hypothetical protein
MTAQAHRVTVEEFERFVLLPENCAPPPNNRLLGRMQNNLVC